MDLYVSLSMLYIAFVLYIVVDRFIATSAKVTPNGILVRESPQSALISGFVIMVICLAIYVKNI